MKKERQTVTAMEEKRERQTDDEEIIITVISSLSCGVDVHI